jgi:hypothetical protein
MCILGYSAIEIGTSSRWMMQSWALGKPGRIYILPFQHSKTNEQKLHFLEIAMQKHQCSGPVGITEFCTILATYHKDLCTGKQMHYEGGTFIQKLYSVVKIFTIEGSHSKS